MDTCRVLHEPAITVEIFMAGDIAQAKQEIRRFVLENKICVTVSPIDYIYNGGQEAGFVVGLRNYPKFPSDAYTLRRLARDLAELLRRELCQDSFMVSDGSQSVWSSTRGSEQ